MNEKESVFESEYLRKSLIIKTILGGIFFEKPFLLLDFWVNYPFDFSETL